MRLRGRHLFAAISATSLLFAVLVGVAASVGEVQLWNYRGTRLFLMAYDRHSIAVVSARAIEIDRMTPAQRNGLHRAFHQQKGFGFWFAHGDAGVWGMAEGRVEALKAADHVVAFGMPSVISIPALMALPTIWCVVLWRASRGERRKRRGECTSCGYDLRASPHHCPECGALAK
jgi:hypothetical protein